VGPAAAGNDPAGESARTGRAGDGIRPGPAPGAGQSRPRAGRWLGWLERVPVPRPGNGGRLARRAGVAGLGVVAAGGLAVAVIAAGQARAELDRGPTTAERSAAAATALALRWRAWPAGQIFPARLRYGAPGRQDQAALRVGISPQTGCAAGLDPVAGAAAARRGCQAVLRATYTDRLQGIVWTVGVVAFREPGDAASFLRTLAGSQPLTSRPEGGQPRAGQPRAGQPRAWAVRHGYLRTLPPLRTPVGTQVISGPAGGVRALAIPQSVAGLFTDRARQLVTGWQEGPYAVLATAGYADGRPARAGLEERPSVFRPAGQLAADVLAPLTVPVPVRCQSPMWQC